MPPLPSLVLASSSPRRRQLLEAAGLTFVVRAADVDESPHPREAPERLATRLATAKARAVADLPDCPGRYIIGADTVVALGDETLGKPGSAAEARIMLRRLSGVNHTVWTGVCVLDREEPESPICHGVETRVRFRSLSTEEIHRYVATGEPLDKAGAYAIQGGGGALVDQIHGSYTNVVGLPLREVLDALAALQEGEEG